MRATIVGTRSPTWSRFLEGVVHDFYQLPAYVAVSAGQDGGEAVALHVEDGAREVLVPLVLRRIDGTEDVDATSPYGYPGVLSNADDDPAFETDALLAGVEELADRGVVSLFIRLHPLLNPDPPEGVGTLVRHGNTVTVDLSLSTEALWNQTRRNHRQQIRQAIKAGYVAEIDPDLGRLEDFKRLYRATMEQRSASGYYFFDDDYFEGLRRALGGALSLGYVRLDDAVAAAALTVETNGIVQMHLSGHDADHAQSQPMKLLFDHIRSWSSRRGDRWLHLGGGRGGEDDSLYHFKAGFSPLRQPFHTRRIIVDPERYAALSTTRGDGTDVDDASGHFPCYRRRGSDALGF